MCDTLNQPIKLNMNIKTTVRKLTGYSENLLTFYLGTVRKYALLDPMLFSKEVCDKYGSRLASNGYALVRETLFYGVVQDIANMFFDKTGTNPSILNIKDMLDHQQVINFLREKYTSEHVIDNGNLRTWHKNRRKERAQEFETFHKELFDKIRNLETSKDLNLCKTIRDKFTSHIDLQFSGGNYSYPDISKYGIKWGTPKRLLNELKPIIIRIGYVVRQSGFAWDTFDSQNNKIASGLWSI